MDFPALLRTQRAGRRWPQMKAASALGLTFYRYRHLEAGHAPTDGEIEAVAQVFGLTPRAIRSAMKAGLSGPDGKAASVA